MNILEIAIRPTSLCMRLFGNVLGAFVIMELIKLVVPVFVPAIFSLYFDLFDGLIKTYVFVFLHLAVHEREHRRRRVTHPKSLSLWERVAYEAMTERARTLTKAACPLRRIRASSPNGRAKEEY